MKDGDKYHTVKLKGELRVDFTRTNETGGQVELWRGSLLLVQRTFNIQGAVTIQQIIAQLMDEALQTLQPELGEEYTFDFLGKETKVPSSQLPTFTTGILRQLKELYQRIEQLEEELSTTAQALNLVINDRVELKTTLENELSALREANTTEE